MNCWEFMNCGRGPGGKYTSNLGLCSAAFKNDFSGINNGKFGGRFCWYITGTFCNNSIQGTFAKKLKSCIDCEFYKLVEKEEGRNLVLFLKDKAV